MIWEHKKVIYFESDLEWWKSHFSAPVPFVLDDKTVRVFFGAFDQNNVSRVAYVDLNIDDFSIIGYSKKPVLDIGNDGTFDENGVHPMGVIRKDDKVYLYYTGYELGNKVPYYMFAGLAISEDNGHTFKRCSQAPVLDRSDEGLCTRGGPTGFIEDGIFKLWYAAGTIWEPVGGKQRPTYNVFYIESPDGINIGKQGKLCISYDPKTEHGLGRPQVFKVGSKYKMVHTIRTLDLKYSIGYAESDDGINWTRKDHELGLVHGKSGWNSDMIYFPYITNIKDDYYLFYNGNSFGKTGFGIEKLIKW